MNKKAISGIVATVIMIGLVIVVVGVVWVVINNLISSEAEEIDYSQKCLGISLKVDSLDCDGVQCNIELKRQLGSKSDSFEGVGVSLSSDTSSAEGEIILEGNIAVTKTSILVTDFMATEADVRIYIEKDNGEKYWCSQIASYP